MAKSSPLISVVVPTYNEEKYIQKCLASLLNQSLDQSEYEIIVVDNGSRDTTRKIVKDYPVRLITLPNPSVVKARQKGVDVSRGTIIASADADTVYPRNWLANIKHTFDKQPKVIGVVGWIYFTNSKPLFNYSVALSQEINLFLYKVFGQFPLVFAANFAFLKVSLLTIGGYPLHLRELGDQQYLLFKLQKIGKVAVVKKLYCHTSGRRHSAGTKNIIIYNGWHRLVGYVVNSLLKKEVIGPSPAIRSRNGAISGNFGTRKSHGQPKNI